eukprot:6176580-Pleurochrysis_carterae.AAC.1
MSSTSVWIPISKATAEQSPNAGYYEQSISMGKRMSLFLGPDKRIVGKIFQMLPDSEAVSRLPSKASDISEEGAEKLLPAGWRNAGIVFAHGYTGNCYDMYRMCERLARRGYVVIAPNFADSSSNATLSVTGLGPAATAEGVILRMHTVDCMLKYLKNKFGISSVGLLGYSLGTDTIRYHQMSAPRVYIAGPGWTKARDPETVVPEPPKGPSMLLVSMSDHGPPPPPGTANESGYPDRIDLTTSMLLGAEKLPEHSQHIHQTIPHSALACVVTAVAQLLLTVLISPRDPAHAHDAHVVQTDEAHIGSMTLGMMKLCPEKDGDLEEWTAFNGGCVELFFNQFL